MKNEEPVMINLPDERPFALFYTRLVLSVQKGSTPDAVGRYDMIVKGDMNELASALVDVALDHNVIGDFLITVAKEYKKRKK